MNLERVLILIDGGNIYSALYKEKEDSLGNKIAPLLPKGFKFDYKKFCEYLANGREIIAIRYYIGIVRNTDGTSKSELMVLGQQKFLAKLENAGIKIERGRVVYDHGKTREKGVDVKIAIDIVIEGYENTYDSVIIISSDSDLIPAVKYIVTKKKKVEYIGFQNHYSTALINECSTQRVLAGQDLQQFELSEEEAVDSAE
ncbi:MAG TPA: NYN domain-containing protein [Candidatus Paceibacterota bacterium]|nr:NYN domain-containing protein [Candidatus Paceibacterota bacterium]